MHRMLMAGNVNRCFNCAIANISAPIFDDAFPAYSAGHLLQHVGDQNPRPAKSRLAVTNLRIVNDVATDDHCDCWFGHLAVSTIRADGAKRTFPPETTAHQCIWEALRPP